MVEYDKVVCAKIYKVLKKLSINSFFTIKKQIKWKSIETKIFLIFFSYIQNKNDFYKT